MKDIIYGKDSDGLIVTETMVLELLADIIYASKQKNNAGDQYFFDKALQDWKWPGSVMADPAGEEEKIIEWYETYNY